MKNVKLFVFWLLLSCVGAQASVIYYNSTNSIATVQVVVTPVYAHFWRASQWDPWEKGGLYDGQLRHLDYYTVSPGQCLYIPDTVLDDAEPYGADRLALAHRQFAGERFDLGEPTEPLSPVVNDPPDLAPINVDPLICSADATVIVKEVGTNNSVVTSTTNLGTAEDFMTVTLGSTLEIIVYGQAPGYLSVVGWGGYDPDGGMLGDSINLSGAASKRDSEFVRYFTPTRSGTYLFFGTACATYGMDSPMIYVTVVDPQ